MMNTETTETFAELGIPINPFPGLRPFEFNESHLFFGRDGQSEQLISKLGRTHFLAVVGTSGSGKSSLVRAGLMPALLGGFMSSAGSNWRIAIMRPGNDPIGNLARALNAPDVFGSEIKENAALQTVLAEAALQRGSRGLVDAVRQAVVAENENLLILVDQFEEIFRFAQVAEDKEYGNEAAAFVKLLLEAARQRELPIYVVLTMRSDYLGDCSQFWGLPEEINESQYLIPRLTRDQLREAMTGPINVARGQITPRLVARLLNDVGEDQDQLPVLQHLLMRVWDEWKEQRLEVEVKKDGTTTKATHRSMHEGDALDICCYDAVGGMTQALSRHADEAFNDLPNDAAREIAERLFKTLTEKGTDNREIRRPVTLGEICAALDASASEVINVIETFRRPGRSFLMPPAEVSLTADSLIDISHESLIRGWARLKQWVDEETRSARIYLRVAETAVLRDEGGAGLWRDPDLQIALTWRQQSKPNEIWARRYHTRFNLAMNFLDDSVAARDAEVEKEEARRKREIRRTRLTALILAGATVVSMLAGGYAVGQSVKARNAQLEAENQARLARYSFEEAEKQKANAEREKEGAIAAQKDAVRLKDEANEAKGRAEVSAAEAQANLVEANKQRIAAQKASELVKAEALKGQGLSALKEGNENAAIFYFNQLHEHYMKSNDQSGQSFALANIANIYKDRVPMFLNANELDEVEEGSEDYAKVIRQYMQSYVFAAQVQDKDDETIKQEILKNSRQARDNYEQALAANRDAARGNATHDLFLKRGNILQSIGDLYLYELQDEFKGDLTTKENTEKAFEKAVDYYTQAASAYEDAARPLEEAEMLKKMGDVLYKNWTNAVSKSESTTAKAGRSEAPAARQLDSRTSQIQLGHVIGLYEKAKTQFEQAENPSRGAAALVRIAKIYEDLPKESPEGRNAVDYLEQARVIYRNQKNFSKEAATAEKIAQLYEETSDAKQQVSALKQALEAYGNAAAAAKPKQRSEYENKISDLLSSIGTVLFESTDKETVNRFFEEVINRSDDQLLKASILGSIAKFYKGKNNEETVRYLNRKRAVYQQARNFLEEGNVLFEIGSLHEEAEQPAEAMKAFDAAFIAYRQVGDAVQDSTLTNNLIDIAAKYAKTDKHKAIAVYEEALNAAKLYPLSTPLVTVVRAAGTFLVQMKSDEGNAKARQFFQKALEASRTAENKGELSSIIGDIYKEAGDKKEARASYDRAIAVFRSDKQISLYPYSVVFKKIAVLETEGNPQRSLADFYLSEADSARRSGDLPTQALLLELAADFYRGSRDERKAIDYFEEARSLYNRAGLKTKEAFVLRDLAAIYELQGNKQKAAELRKQANQLGP